MLVCIALVLAPFALAFLARAIMAAPHVALLVPTVGALAGLAAIASALP